VLLESVARQFFLCVNANKKVMDAMKLRLGLLCSIVIVCCNHPSPAATVQVSASGFTSLDDGLSRTPIDVQHTILANGAERVTGSGTIGGNTGDPPLFRYSAAVTGLAEAGPGRLKARVVGEAVAASFIPNVPALTGGTPRAVGGFSASYHEFVELSHPTLPVGSPVEFQVSLVVDVATNNPAYFPQHAPFARERYATGSIGLSYLVGTQIGTNLFLPNSLFQTVPELHFTQEFSGSGHVGDLLPVYTSLSVGSDNRAGPYEIDGFMSNYGREQHTVIDASNTVRLFLDPLTPGLTFESESGHDYRSTAVPEPASVVLLIASVALAMRRSRSLLTLSIKGNRS
jgi:hypothetical protein